MMHQGLDLSRFKKVSSDKKTTTLRHRNGHEIKIAHSALTPKMKADLESLEDHKENGRKRYAEGTPDEPVSEDDDAESEDPAALDPESPAPAPEEAPQAQAAPQPAAPAAVPPKPDVMPVAGEVDIQGQRPQPGIDSNELKQQDALWAQDLNNGHIQPKTYKDLFAKKDTLGKIGTLFGLMVGGAGAGLSHQPNAVMDMMNKEIANDLEAQKTSKTNANNFLELNRKMLFDQASMRQMVKEGKLTEAQAKSMEAEANTKAYTLARMQKNRVALHELVLMANKYPVGSPQRQAADQQLALLSKTIDSENFDLADRAAAASALGNMAYGQDQGGDEGKFQQGQGALRMSGNEPLAKDRSERHMPGVEGMASVPLSGEDRTKITSGVTFQRQMEDFINWTKKHSGDLSPSDRKTGIAKAAALQGAYRQASNGGVYKEGEQHFIGKIINDVPTVFFNKIRVLPSLAAVKQDSALQLDQHLKSLGFKGYKGFKESKDTKTADSDLGRKVRDKVTHEVGYYKNGKFTPANKQANK